MVFNNEEDDDNSDQDEEEDLNIYDIDEKIINITEIDIEKYCLLKLTKYEEADYIGARCTQIAKGADIYVDIGDLDDAYNITLKEYNAGIMVFNTIRNYCGPDLNSKINFIINSKSLYKRKIL